MKINEIYITKVSDKAKVFLSSNAGMISSYAINFQLLPFELFLLPTINSFTYKVSFFPMELVIGKLILKSSEKPSRSTVYESLVIRLKKAPKSSIQELAINLRGVVQHIAIPARCLTSPAAHWRTRHVWHSSYPSNASLWSVKNIKWAFESF